jgi:4-hydroxy-tetrahydrodipicolinate synthase
MPVEGILPVIPTPFVQGRFDATSFQRFLDYMLPFVDGYTLLGSTGEAPSLSSADRREIAHTALEMTPPDKTVVVGVSHTSANESVALAQHAEQCGARAVLCSAPYYFANSSAGILRHLKALDGALGIDLVLYDNPVATKTVLPAEWVLDWASRLERLRTVKLTDHDLTKVEAWQRAGLRVLAGDDPILFRYLTAGVDGVMVIAPAVFPEAFRDTWSLIKEGDEARALKVFSERILPFTHVFGIGDEIATTKALLHEIGVFASDELLPPLVGVGSARRRLLRTAYDLATQDKGGEVRGSVAVQGGS